MKNKKTEEKEFVALLHGIANPYLVMAPLAITLEKAGYEAHNIDYPSLKSNIDRLTLRLHKELVKQKAFDYKKLHFVTHSMGGLVVRAYLSRRKPGNLGRVVMLAPPNNGSEVADLLRDIWLYKAFYGPAGQELTTEARDSYGKTPVDFELGIIAGTSDILNPVSHFLMDGPNDGIVTVESTKLPGMKDHTTVNAPHATIMVDPRTQKEVLHFLRKGSFEK